MMEILEPDPDRDKLIDELIDGLVKRIGSWRHGKDRVPI